MLDIKFIRENQKLVKDNIKKNNKIGNILLKAVNLGEPIELKLAN